MYREKEKEQKQLKKHKNYSYNQSLPSFSFDEKKETKNMLFFNIFFGIGYLSIITNKNDVCVIVKAANFAMTATVNIFVLFNKKLREK